MRAPEPRLIPDSIEQAQARISRPNLSADLTTELREMIFDGRLPAGSRINEVHLSEQLGVSRTPLREALTSLAGEGAIRQEPRRGFFVCDLSEEEARDIYIIRAFLDVEALRMSGLPTKETLKELAQINDQLRKAKDVREAIRLDDAFFIVLWQNCPNRTLTDLIRFFMRRTRRYELASMSQEPVLESSCRSKRAVIDALSSGDMDAACQRLRKSLEGGVVPVLEWLKGR